MKAVSPVSKEEVEENIREVADAILDYCASPVEGKPAAVKQVGWLWSAGCYMVFQSV